MDLTLVTIALMALVSGVYWAGYRTGFRASQEKMAVMFKSFGDPIAVLLDRVSASVEQAADSPRRDGREGG